MTNHPRTTRRRCGAAVLLMVAALAPPPAARAQNTASEEAARRSGVLAALPRDAAQRAFGLATTPAPGPARAIGGYAKGCVSGAIELPADGATWQVMRPSRNRGWGQPVLIELLQRLAARAAAEAQWPGLLVGDIGQPRGGPMLTGHESHQIGLDADIWLRPMPDRRLSTDERDNISATNVVASNGLDIDPAAWLPQHRKLLETAAKMPGIVRIFVNPAIKRALCREAGDERGWLRVIRPWWGHNYHFHLRLGCPEGQVECQGQAPTPPGDGCNELAGWFTPEALHPKPGPPHRPPLVSDLPAGCAALAR